MDAIINNWDWHLQRIQLPQQCSNRRWVETNRLCSRSILRVNLFLSDGELAICKQLRPPRDTYTWTH